jgi:hypothetical protein
MREPEQGDEASKKGGNVVGIIAAQIGNYEEMTRMIVT